MAPRLRLFVKKRGRRLTGPRWFGTLAVVALDVALAVLGAVGLYWLLARVLLAEDSQYGWLAWSAVVIPFAPIVYGIADLVVLLWQNLASTERRAAAVQMATDWDLPGLASAGARPTLPAVPPVDAIIDSPGVRLAYRLPSDAISGQLSFALAAVCLAWNILVIGFIVRVVRQHWTGEPNWLLTWLIVPFLLAGIWTIYAFVRQILLTTGTGTTLLEVSEHPLFPGGNYEAFLSQTGRLHVRWFQVQLVCEERATYQQGTDTRMATASVHRETLFSQRKFDIPPGGAFETHFTLPIPAGAMHSFLAAHNAVSWALVVRGRMARWPEFERRFPLYVYPAPVAPSAAATTATVRRVEHGST